MAEDTEVAGCPVRAGDRVLLSFPAANRDPDADRVVIDRLTNRHIAFGVGHPPLRRLEFRIEDERDVTWAGGQVRGPRTIPVVLSA